MVAYGVPFTYSIDVEERLVRVQCDGNFTIDEMIRHSLRVNEDPDFVPGMDTLSDLRNAHLIDEVTALRDYLEHTKQLEQFRGACWWACLVADESARDLIWTFDLLLRERKSGIRTKGFFKENEAMEWLRKRKRGEPAAEKP